MARAVDLGKVAVWQGRLRRFVASGSSITEFCRQEGVSAASFYLWRKRLAKYNGPRGEPNTPAARHPFVPVWLTGTTVPPIVIRLPNGVRVRLPGDNLPALRAGIEAAATLPGTTAVSGQEAARC
jgi:transposase-like protein